MKRSRLLRVGAYLCAMVMCLSVICAEAEGVMDSTYNVVSTDALGREADSVQGMRSDKYVGVFYFAWHGQSSTQKKVYDVTQMLKEDADSLFGLDNTAYAPTWQFYHYNEPLFGYYNSSDPWVIRKHIEMFIAADVDFIAYDFTNAEIFLKPLRTMLNLLLEYQEAGWDVPQVTFYTKTNSAAIVQQLYRQFYTRPAYDSLWFRADGDKPWIIGDGLNTELQDFFHVRASQWPEEEFKENGFPYLEKVRPQRLFTDVVSVSAAQHTGNAFSWSVRTPDGSVRQSWGRGYTTQTPENGNADRIEAGANFQEQWDTAIELDPKIIFVTGWNEWTALKLSEPSNSYFGDMGYWVDSFNTEFSRDIEMTRMASYDGDNEGYGDNYYLQLVQNIRRFKGIEVTEDNFVAPSADGVTYHNIATENVERDFRGYTTDIKYTQAAAVNFIEQVSIKHDDDNIYVTLVTQGEITLPAQDVLNQLNILIGVGNTSSAPSWEGFNYVLNRHIGGCAENMTSLERASTDGAYEWERMDDVACSVSSNILTVTLPRASIGVDGRDFMLKVRATDSIENPSDPLDYYVSGCSVPLGRLSLSYATSYEALTSTYDAGNNNEDNPTVLTSSDIGKYIAIVAAAVVVAAAAVVAAILFKKKRGTT